MHSGLLLDLTVLERGSLPFDRLYEVMGLAPLDGCFSFVDFSDVVCHLFALFLVLHQSQSSLPQSLFELSIHFLF